MKSQRDRQGSFQATESQCNRSSYMLIGGHASPWVCLWGCLGRKLIFEWVDPGVQIALSHSSPHPLSWSLHCIKKVSLPTSKMVLPSSLFLVQTPVGNTGSPWVSSLWTQIHTIVSLGPPACRRHSLDLLSLHNHISWFLKIDQLLPLLLSQIILLVWRTLTIPGSIYLVVKMCETESETFSGIKALHQWDSLEVVRIRIPS